ncbi:MAG: glycosyl hydrolase family 18 protein, partial [Terrimicrobiaceae bacterium]
MRKNNFIFHDVRGSRWRRFKVLAALGTIVGIGALVLFIQALLVSPPLDAPNSLQDLKKQIRTYAKQSRLADPSESDKALSKQLARGTPAGNGAGSTHPSIAPDIRAAFFMGWDEASFRSLALHQDVLTHLCPEWLSFTSLEDGIREDEDAGLERLPASKSLKLMPVLTNLAGSKRIPEGVESLAQADQKTRQAFVEQLAGHLHKIKAAGVVIDWEEIDPGLTGELTETLQVIADELRAEGLETWLCVTMDAGFGAYDFERLAAHVDRFVALLHDENGAGDSPGPLASQDWFDGWAKVISHCGSPQKWIASLGCYGSDWEEGSSSAEQISFSDAMSRAGNSGAAGVQTGDPSYNGSFSYFYEGKGHEVWFLDAASFYNELQEVRAYGFGGIAVNRLGVEDPAVWSILSSELAGKPPQLGA